MKLHLLLLSWLLAATAPLTAQTSVGALEYQSPRPSSHSVSRHGAIILRPGPLIDRSTLHPGLLSVTGEASGRLDGRLDLARDGRTIVFIPSRPFAAGERVRVELSAGLRAASGAALAPHAFSFTTDATPDDVLRSVRIPSELSALDREAAEGVAAAVGDFPEITVTTVDDPAPGRLYLANLAFSPQVATVPHLMVLDDAGVPLFKRRLGMPGFDFKRQPNGTVTYYDSEQGLFAILDSTYTQIGSVNVGAGFQTDVHELLILPNGNALLMGLAPRRTDLSGVVPGGRTDAIVLDMVIQEIQSDGLVVFEWRSVDHFQVTDALHEDLTGETVDHVHPNSLDVDTDGNILLSSRHLDEVTKISRTTGQIIWRLGGKHNQFEFTNDPDRFSYQHDARRVADGNLLLYDNGNHHPTPSSRAVEYRLDERAMTATRVWQYRHTPEIFSYAMGNAQRLPNGNTLIAWGAHNVVTEVRPDGTVAFEMSLPPGVFTYRAFRQPAATSLVTTELLSPPDDSLDLAPTVDLSWERSGGAAGYHVQVAMDEAFTTVVFDDASVSATSARVGPLAEWTRFFWRVRPVGPEITGVWSAVRSFHTGGVVQVLTLLAPPHGASGLPMAPVLRWEPFAGATSYRLQMSENDVFFNAPEIDTVMSHTALWLDSIGAASRYYWRVQPIGASGSGNWSQIRDFRTASQVSPMPERIVLLNPTNGSRVAGEVDFAWSAESIDGMVASRVIVASDAAGAAIPTELRSIVDTTVEASQLVLPRGVLGTTTYWWSVRATDSLGRQYTSPVHSFANEGASGVVSDAAIAGSAVVPNPVTARASLEITLTRASALRVRLLDVRGRFVATAHDGVAPAGTHGIALPLDGMAEGVYLCAVTTSDGTRLHRIVVAR